MFINNNAFTGSPMMGTFGLGSPTIGQMGAQAPASPFEQSAQLAILTQLLSLLTSVIGSTSGEAGVPGTSPMFGQGGGGTGSPGNFLGASGGGGRSQKRGGGGGGTSASGGTSAPSSASGVAAVGPAKDAGGGWVNPVGGDYRVSSGFGGRNNPTGSGSSDHTGIDLAGAANTPIRAAKAGKVTISKDMTTSYGKWIEIQHADGTKSRYAHMNQREVEVGATVKAGQVIGKMGSTGNSTGNHLHFEVINAQGQAVDPSKSLKL